MAIVNWKLARTKRTEHLKPVRSGVTPRITILPISGEGEYKRPSTKRMHNRRNCFSLPKRLFGPTSLSLSLLYKRTIVREKKVRCLLMKLFLLEILCVYRASPVNFLSEILSPFPFIPPVLSSFTHIRLKQLENILGHLVYSEDISSRHLSGKSSSPSILKLIVRLLIS